MYRISLTPFFFPAVIKADINHLKGLALIEKEEGQQKIVHLYPEYDLPENISERFRLLFKRKEKWTLEEITPYIEWVTQHHREFQKVIFLIKFFIY